MAASKTEKSPDCEDRMCSMCNDLFTEPKLLPCFHLLCRHCLVGVLESQPQAQCPICRHPIVQPGPAGPGHSWADVADGLPTDLAMAELVEADRLWRRKHQCCICEKAAATFLCLTCHDLFCNTCKTVHTKQKLLKDHVVQDLDSLTPNQLLRHGSSSNKSKLDQKAAQPRLTLGQLLERLRSAERELELALQQLDQVQKESKDKVDGALAVLDRLKAALDARYQRARADVQDLYADVSRQTQAGKVRLLQRGLNVSACKGAVLRTLDTQSLDALKKMTPVMTQRVESLDCSTDIPEEIYFLSEVSVQIDPSVVELIEKKLDALGQVQVMSPDTKTSATFQPTLSQAMVIVSDPKQGQFRFHDNHGKNIKLSNKQQTAEKIGTPWDDGIVISTLPMTRTHLYQVVMHTREPFAGWTFRVGVVTQEPAAVDIPPDAGGWTAAVVIWNGCVDFQGKWDTRVKVGSRLFNIPKDSRVGVLIDSKRCLHLYIDGVDHGVAASNIPQPCYPFFELSGPYRQITALPVERLK